jgi:hypothetical protein
MPKFPPHPLKALLAFLVLFTGQSASGFAQATKLHAPAITPATLTLTSTDPDSGVVNGSGTAVLVFRTTSGLPSRTWTVKAQATSTTFVGCPSPVQTSVVKLTCTSVIVDAPGTGACAPQITLSTASQLLASGVEDGKSNSPYTINFNVDIVFADAWNYIPTTTGCTASLSYEIVAN